MVIFRQPYVREEERGREEQGMSRYWSSSGGSGEKDLGDFSKPELTTGETRNMTLDP